MTCKKENLRELDILWMKIFRIYLKPSWLLSLLSLSYGNVEKDLILQKFLWLTFCLARKCLWLALWIYCKFWWRIFKWMIVLIIGIFGHVNDNWESNNKEDSKKIKKPGKWLILKSGSHQNEIISEFFALISDCLCYMHNGRPK